MSKPQLRSRRQLASAVGLAALALASPGSAGVATATSNPTPLCGEFVELAPTLLLDHNPDGTSVHATPDRRGKYVPIVMVHGWTARSTHSAARTGTFSHLIDLTTIAGTSVKAQRSLIGQLQRIPGAAVYTFDYHDYSARWVDDPHLGPRLGKAIDCLYNATGEKVIVVGHSMGGLLARYALTHGGDSNTDRSHEVSTVVTFGTPETGSPMASLVANALDTGAAAGAAGVQPLEPLAVLRLVLATCGSLSTQKIETGTPCDFVPAFARAFDTDAGRALEAGSSQLAALKPFPKTVTLDALAGDTTLRVPKLGWFAAPWATSDVAMGDMIVNVSSATDGATQAKRAPCAYQLNVVRGVTDAVGLAFRQISNTAVAQPIWAVKGPCFHTNLMRTIQLTNEAAGAVSADIEGRQTGTAHQPPAPRTTPLPSVGIPTCSEWEAMTGQDRDAALRSMADARGDQGSLTVTRFSVQLFCKLNPGRQIDGIYAPASRAPQQGNDPGSTPTCAEWRQMNDAQSDAALLRVARQQGNGAPHISTLRLITGGYCALHPDRTIDQVPRIG